MAWPKSFQPKSGECEGCSHVRQHVSGCLPEKSGGHQIARNERFSHRHMSNDTSSSLPSRSSECVSGPSVPEGSNPQDRVEPKPDRSRQDFSCLGQTIRGSVRPREEHEIGNIRLTHSGGDVLESGQSCPELGRPVRICIPFAKPNKGLSKQGQNRKRIRQLIKQAYSAVQDEDIPHLTHTNFQARELRAFASSLAFHQNYSLKQVMETASWRNNNTFVSFYLRYLSQMGDVTTAVRKSYLAD